jgi:undecaprenyl diphosphate synthase
MKKQDLKITQSTGIHVAIIMDGNGRWATRQGLPRFMGHRAGGEAVRRIVEHAPEAGIGTLTLYAFSSDNWQRPENEVSALMRLFNSYLKSETDNCVKNGVKLNFIGRRDRLSPSLVKKMETAEKKTCHGNVLHLRVAIDYSARDIIFEAARHMKNNGNTTLEEFNSLLARVQHDHSHSVKDVDLLIRTGGEQRLSDFLLWECAYAELLFTETMWPDFSEQELQNAVDDFYHRERRFGRVPAAAAV